MLAYSIHVSLNHELKLLIGHHALSMYITLVRVVIRTVKFTMLWFLFDLHLFDSTIINLPV